MENQELILNEIRSLAGTFAGVNKAQAEMAEKLLAVQNEARSALDVADKTKKAADEAEKRFAERMAQYEAEKKELLDRVGQAEARSTATSPSNGKPQYRSLGEAFDKSEALKEFRSKHDLKGRTPGFNIELEKRTISNSAASMGDAVMPLIRPEIIAEPGRPNNIRDLFTAYPCNTDTVFGIRESFHYPLMTTGTAIEPINETVIAVTDTKGFYAGQLIYVGVLSYTIAANGVDAVAKTITLTQGLTVATAVGTVIWSKTFDATAELYEKPETDFGVEDFSINMQWIAYLLKASRQIIKYGGASLQRFVDAKLFKGLKENIEFQLLYGNGTNQLTGLKNVTGKLTYNWSQGEVNDTEIDALIRARNEIGKRNGNADRLVFNSTYETKMLLLKSSQGSYLNLVNPVTGQVWMLRYTMSNAVADKDFFMWDSSATALFEGEGYNVATTDSNEDDFKKNKILMRAEESLALMADRPAGILYGLWDNAPVQQP